jgi:hypothetical protein
MKSGKTIAIVLPQRNTGATFSPAIHSEYP